MPRYFFIIQAMISVPPVVPPPSDTIPIANPLSTPPATAATTVLSETKLKPVVYSNATDITTIDTIVYII